MQAETDEEVLVQSYAKLADRIAKRAKAKPLKEDKTQISNLETKLSRIKYILTETNGTPAAEVQKVLLRAKGLYIQYIQVEKRRPECISKNLSKTMNQVVRAVCKYEADMIAQMRIQQMGGKRIDIAEVFMEKKNINLLSSKNARDIVHSAMKQCVSTVGILVSEDHYITRTGNRYHIQNCPYCRGRYLSPVTQLMIENQKLLPCKCIASEEQYDDSDQSQMTVFIDESIRTVMWNANGSKGRNGSYSYIICRGRFQEEKYISDTNILTYGVEPLPETRHVERLTEAAISKVMITLAYDYEFTGTLHIYTDNQTTVKQWNSTKKNSKLASLFDSVSVQYIPRNKNTKADRLGRSNVILKLPVNTYNDIVMKCKGYDITRVSS